MVRAPIRERFLTVRGRRARILESGSGPPLVLLPSIFLGARRYGPAVRRLARRFRVLALEQPGSGWSDPFPIGEPRTLHAYADWVAEAIAALGLDRPIVVGHSQSGAVAVLLAARHPDRLAGLVLIGAVGARSRWLLQLALGRLLDACLEPLFSLRAAPYILANLAWYPSSFLPQLLSMSGVDLTGEATRVRAPTLVGWGRLDFTLPRSDARRWCAAIPRARLHLARGSHNWIITHPEDFADAVFGLAEDDG